MAKNERVRIEGINAPETRTKNLEEKKLGYIATDRVAELMPVGSTQTLMSKAFQGKFGRILGDFYLEDKLVTLASVLLIDDFVAEYTDDQGEKERRLQELIDLRNEKDD